MPNLFLLTSNFTKARISLTIKVSVSLFFASISQLELISESIFVDNYSDYFNVLSNLGKKLGLD